MADLFFYLAKTVCVVRRETVVDTAFDVQR